MFVLENYFTKSHALIKSEGAKLFEILGIVKTFVNSLECLKVMFVWYW